MLIAVTTAEQKGVKATDINRIAKAALLADASPTATVAGISALLNAQFAKLGLPAGDVDAIAILEIAFSAAVATKLSATPTVAAVQTDIATVLNAMVVDTGG